MPRVTFHGPSRPITRTGVIGYDPDATTGEVPDPIDYADDAGWFMPALSAGIVALVNSHGTTSITNAFGTWGFTPTVGSLLVIAVAIRDGGSSTAPSGWTLLEDNAPAAGTGFDDGAALYGKVSDGTETSVTFAYSSPTAGMHHVIMEFSGLDLTGYTTNESTVVGPAGTSVTTGSVTPTAGAQALIVGLSAGWATANPHTPGAGWTEVYDAALAGPEHPGTTVIYQIVASASGSYNPATTASNSIGWRGVTSAFAEPAEVVWLPAFAVHDGSNTTFESVAEASITGAADVFLRGVLTTDVVLSSVVLRLGLEDAGSATITLEGATDEDFTTPVELDVVTQTATGSYTSDTWTFSPIAEGYVHLRFVLTVAQGARPFEVTLTGLPDPAATIADHLTDTTDAHDASAVSLLDTAGNTATTNVEDAIAELYGLTDIWRPVMAHDGTNWYVVVDGDGTAVMAQG